MSLLLSFDIPMLTHDAPRYYPHYDGRYMQEPLELAAQNAGIKVLMQTYLATFRDLGVQTWLMHGSLLGWWWGKKVRSLITVVYSPF